MATENIRIAPHLYGRKGKRGTSYFTRANGEHVPLGSDLEEAKRKLATMLALPQSAPTIRAMCDGYLKEQRHLREIGDKACLAEGTINDYELCLATVCKVFGHMPPREFTATHGAKYLKMRRSQGNGPRGNREIAALSSAFNYGLTCGDVEANPCRGFRRNKESPRNRKVEVSELNAFLAHAKSLDGSAYMVALIGCCVALTGRRRAEILRLELDGLGPDGFHATESKVKPGQVARRFFVRWSPTLLRMVEEAKAVKRRKPGRYLFPTNDGTPYTDSGFKTLWNRLMHSYAPGGSKSPEWFRAHDLRALYVSEMLSQGRAPNTHRNEETMRRVYDRRRDIQVDPLA